MAKNAERFCELLESISKTENDTERADSSGAQIIQEWDKLVNNLASIVTGKKLTICDRAVKWWDEEAEAADKVNRTVSARYSSSKSTAEWEEYVTARKYTSIHGRDEDKEGGIMERHNLKNK